MNVIIEATEKAGNNVESYASYEQLDSSLCSNTINAGEKIGLKLV